MKILALIAARGGSKRLPGKNIRPLGGRPLIEWSIEVARGLHEVNDVLVSTDSADIASVSRTAGALVPWLRPASLATDEASSVDVALHALDWYEADRGAVDGLMLLQPTSPLRRRESVERGIELFRGGAGRGVIGVSRAPVHPWWCFRIEGTSMRPFCDADGRERRSQDLPQAFALNGGFYLLTPAQLRGRRSFYAEDMRPLVMDAPGENVDIDTEQDWQRAEQMLATTGAQ